MIRCCNSRSHNECCKEWVGPVIFIFACFGMMMFLPDVFGLVVASLATLQGATIIMGLASALVFRKAQVRSWEIDRPFNDGIDETPDPYLFNPGPGATWGLRAFMPDVEIYSFWKQPISWCVKQAKRKVAILLDDGTVSFTWFPVAWISDSAGRGSRISVPQGWKITAHQAKVLQTKRDAIKNIVERHRTEYHRDFMAFTDLIFAQIGVEPVLVNFPQEIASCACGNKENEELLIAGISQLVGMIGKMVSGLDKISGNVASKIDIETIVEMSNIKAELADWREKRPTTIGRHQKILLLHDKRITDLEIASGIKKPLKPKNPPNKK